MDCPNCGTLIFDAYTTEQRIKDLYNVNTTAGWANNRLRILIEMMEDRLRKDFPLPPLDPQWIINDLRKTMDGLQTVAGIEEKRKQAKP